MHAKHAARPAGTYVLIALLVLLAIGALYGGGALIADPSGGLLGMPLALIADTPFQDYLLPGIILFGMLGVAPLAVAAGLWLRPNWGRARWMRKHGSWYAAMAVGCALIVWILVQMTILRFVLQPILLAQGLAILAVSFLPAVRKDFTLTL